MSIVSFALMLYYGYYIQPVSLFFFALSVFVLVGSSNACNLTDGLDGLLAGLSLISLVAFFVLFLEGGSFFLYMF